MKIVLCQESGSDKDDSSVHSSLDVEYITRLMLGEILFKGTVKMLVLDPARILMKLDVKTSLCSV